MCVGIPMKVMEAGAGYALCEWQGERRRIDTQLVGDQAEGTWLLTFLNSARETLSEEDATKISNALEALNMAMSGETNFDHLFADLIDREPQLPEHLRDQQLTSTIKKEGS